MIDFKSFSSLLASIVAVFFWQILQIFWWQTLITVAVSPSKDSLLHWCGRFLNSK